MAKFIMDIYESEKLNDNFDEKLSDCGQLIFSARSKKHVMDDLTCKLLAKLDESEDIESWYFDQISVCDQLVPVVNFINGNIADLVRLTKEQIKSRISQKMVLGFGQVQPIRLWIARNLKAYH